MKIAIINTYSNGSTGTIASSIGKYALTQGNEVRLYYGRQYNEEKNNWRYIGENRLALFASNLLTLLSGNVGSFHISSTKRLINELKSFEPDVIHLHNIHGNYLNFKMLFVYLKKFQGKVVITLHDEFLLTGRCALCFCEKWRTGCESCKYLNAYPRVFVDRSKKLQQQKLLYLKGIRNLTLVTPSLWLKSLVKESMLKDIPCICIHNGMLDTNPEEFDISDIIDKKRINILFAAYTWSINKGALVIKEIASRLDKSKFNIIITGYDNYCDQWFDFDCKKIGLLKRNKMLYLLKNIDVFINPTFKDNLPSILIECLQVGTPSITFNTGGCSEIIDERCGVVTKQNTTESLLKEINSFDKSHFDKNSFNDKFKQFSLEKMGSEYMLLFNNSMKPKDK